MLFYCNSNNARCLEMNVREKRRSVSTIWNARGFLVVLFGALFLLVSMFGFASNQEEAKETRSLSKEEIRTSLNKLEEINQERRTLKDKQDKYFEQLGDLKRRTNGEHFRPDSILARRRLEKTAGELHNVLEEESQLAKRQLAIVKKLLDQKTETQKVIKGEQKILQRQIQNLEKGSPAAARVKIPRMEEKIEKLGKMEAYLEILEENPRASFLLERSGEHRMHREGDLPTRRRGHMGGKHHDLSDDEMQIQLGARVWPKIRRLERRMEFLKTELDRTRGEINQLQDVLKRVRERHPDIFTEIERDLPPPAKGLNQLD